ncbi:MULTISPECIES: class I SAM-dependent methyltransferase [Amycolatopsis]|uniref:Methyltransferase domain-containing protein n=2 Tax=Amycolatopsis TaxID=1813 RepID=A0A1I4C6W7_9PSEU|nr:class I SAM-dependent methyltransferase [Amycolatopsis sacchari]SFK76360.1 Methyltransferase domain-containing protein [Amycolatopsis sacchari]
MTKVSWWNSRSEASVYAALGNPLEWRVAYPELFRHLGFDARTRSPVLDYGRGPGLVASHIADHFSCEVVGCDISADMIELTERNSARPGVRYPELTDQRLESFPDGYFDARSALSCSACSPIGKRIPG